jgi:hypothetical protein
MGFWLWPDLERLGGTGGSPFVFGSFDSRSADIVGVVDLDVACVDVADETNERVFDAVVGVVAAVIVVLPATL